jgi:threonine/homoserine/homoserine lactone efflux protein
LGLTAKALPSILSIFEMAKANRRFVVTIEFLITSLIVVASPGTGALFTIASGLTRGTRVSLIAAFGCTLGILPHLAAAITGLAALLHASALAFNMIKYLGVAYLLYMAWMTLKETGTLRVDQDVPNKTALETIVHAILINILNPKLTIFFFAFLPQFIHPNDGSPLLQMLVLSGIFMLMTFVVFALYGVFAALMRQHVISSPRVLRWMRRGFAGGFAALGAKLAFEQR